MIFVWYLLQLYMLALFGYAVFSLDPAALRLPVAEGPGMS